MAIDVHNEILRSLHATRTGCFFSNSILPGERSLLEALADKSIGTALHRPGVYLRVQKVQSSYPDGL